MESRGAAHSSTRETLARTDQLRLTPDAIITRLHAELVKIVKSPDMSARLNAEASIGIGSTPRQFTTYLPEEIAKWTKVVKFSGARLD